MRQQGQNCRGLLVHFYPGLDAGGGGAGRVDRVGGVRGQVQRAQPLITTGESGNVLALGCWLPAFHDFLPSVSAQRARSCTNVLVTDLGKRK